MRKLACLALASALFAGCASEPAPRTSCLDTTLNARDHFDRATDLRKAGDSAAAVSEYSAAIALRAQYPDAYCGRGIAQQAAPEARLAEPRGFAKVELRAPDRAVEDFQQAMRTTTALNHPAAWTQRGITKREARDLVGAEYDFSEAVRIYPHHAPAWMQRALLRYDRGDWSGALADFEKRAGLKPHDAARDAAALRAWLCRAKLGHRDEANAALRRFLAARDAKQAGDWTAQLAAFLLNDRADFESAGTMAAGQACEAWFYVASKKLILGDRAGAEAAFGKCLATNLSTWIEHRSARVELERLAKAHFAGRK